MISDARTWHSARIPFILSRTYNHTYNHITIHSDINIQPYIHTSTQTNIHTFIQPHYIYIHWWCKKSSAYLGVFSSTVWRRLNTTPGITMGKYSNSKWFFDNHKWSLFNRNGGNGRTDRRHAWQGTLRIHWLILCSIWRSNVLLYEIGKPISNLFRYLSLRLSIDPSVHWFTQPSNLPIHESIYLSISFLYRLFLSSNLSLQFFLFFIY